MQTVCNKKIKVLHTLNSSYGEKQNYADECKVASFSERRNLRRLMTVSVYHICVDEFTF